MYDHGSLLDPSEISTLARSAGWVKGVALGDAALIVAVLAVAAFGLLMLAGRIELRRGAVVIAGCSLIFGAHTMAERFGTVQGPRDPERKVSVAEPLHMPFATPAQASGDPYAGASFK